MSPRGEPAPEVRALLEEVRRAGLRPYAELSPLEIRERMVAARERLPPGREVFSTADFEIPTADGPLPARLYKGAPEPSAAAILYFHGGGWVGGGIALSDSVCRELVAHSRCDVIAVGYRLAPETPFPGAVADADAALAWLTVAPDYAGVVLVGDSAGANLATVAARHARDAGLPPPLLQVLVYPPVDAAAESASFARHTEGLLLNAADMRHFWELYLPRSADRGSPDVSPLYAGSLAGLPPTRLVLAELDPLRDEGLAYAERLRDAGVEVVVDEHEGMIHGFFQLVGLLAGADRAVAAVGEAIARAGRR